jgi:hypothetical protein
MRGLKHMVFPLNLCGNLHGGSAISEPIGIGMRVHIPKNVHVFLRVHVLNHALATF